MDLLVEGKSGPIEEARKVFAGEGNSVEQSSLHVKTEPDRGWRQGCLSGREITCHMSPGESGSRRKGGAAL